MDILTKLIILTIVLINRTKVLSFNIEDRDPIVKKADSRQKGSYFGFSVAQHAVQENSRNKNDYWILVGAPLGQNLQPGTNHSGALFKCPVTKDATDCVQIETDGKRLDSFDYEENVALRGPQPLVPPGDDEIKDSQWLGVTVKSQKPGGKVVVCAHRYIQSPNLRLHHYGMGLCYLLSPNLETEDDLQPCKGRPTEKLHQQFGYCQVGTSLAMLSDGFALMGSPGPYTWRGTIFAKQVIGNFLEVDQSVYKGPLNDNSEPIAKYSYLGMSVTGGHFFSNNTLIYVSGAPRSELKGQVYFFNKKRSIEELDIILTITGEQFGSSFGYELLATDINQDGIDELLVAAPFYYGKDKGGAVYVYDNLKNCSNVSCAYTSVLTGTVESRFGFSMASLGDINKDGYLDVAIGAPYEDDGAIYIYLGSKNGLNKTPSQKIQHRGIGLKTLGYSMSGGLDMDLNDYPDLLVGAYDSDRVILYKTRPIIDISITIEGKELTNINATKKGCAQDPYSNKTCFSFESCFKISKFRLEKEVTVKFVIKELPKKVPRVSFDSGTEQYIRVKNVNKKYCQNVIASLAEGNGDILSPIKLSVNYTLYDNAIDSPILNKTSVKEFEATFQKSCGDDDECKSNLVLETETMLNKSNDRYILDLARNREFVLDVTVTNKGESAYEAKLFVEHPEVLSYVALQSAENQTSNIICTSNNESTLVSCNLGNPLQENKQIAVRMRFEIKDTKQSDLNITVFVNSTSTELSNQTSRSLIVDLRKIASFTIAGKLITPNVFYSGEVKGQSAMRYLDDIGPKVYHAYEITNHGQWNIRDVQVEIRWPYQIFSNREQGGKWLLYLERLPSIEFNKTNYCTVDPPDIVNPLSLTNSGRDEDLPKNTINKIRRKRDTDEVVEPQIITGPDGKQRKVVAMDCARKTAKCAKITCTIPKLDGNNQHVKITIHSRIWNSTLVEDYSKVDWVSIKSFGEVTIRDTESSEDSVKISSVETLAYPGVVLADSGLNIWIIIGAVLAGLVLLIILVFILYKLGFFKRNRIQDHTLSGNLKKQEENETLLKESEGKAQKQ